MTRKNLGLQMLTHSATQSRMSTMMRHDRARSLDTRLPDWVKSPIRSREGSLASPSLSCAPTSLPGRAFQTLRHQQRYTACAARRMRGHSTSCWRLTLSLLRDTTQFRLVTLLPWYAFRYIKESYTTLIMLLARRSYCADTWRGQRSCLQAPHPRVQLSRMSRRQHSRGESQS